MICENYLKLSESYLFAEIAQKVNDYKKKHPEADVISLGIGDVTQPLAPAVVGALHKAADEMAVAASFRGYGPERGYDFLREAIVENDFRRHGIDVEADEIFVSDGAKSDTGIDAPYLWVGTPDGMTSWEFFDWMLRSAHVVCTPGVGFGDQGEGFVRLTAFGTHENTVKALRRINSKL